MTIRADSAPKLANVGAVVGGGPQPRPTKHQFGRKRVRTAIFFKTKDFHGRSLWLDKKEGGNGFYNSLTGEPNSAVQGCS